MADAGDVDELDTVLRAAAFLQENGQSTDMTLTAASRLNRGLNANLTLIPSWASMVVIGGEPDLSDKNRPALPQICKAKQDYRMNRRLSRPEQAQLVEEYRSGKSTLELARRFGINRHTVAKHLQRLGIVIRGGQVKMTPDVIEHARRLYADGRSLVAIGIQLGVDSSTV